MSCYGPKKNQKNLQKDLMKSKKEVAHMIFYKKQISAKLIQELQTRREQSFIVEQAKRLKEKRHFLTSSELHSFFLDYLESSKYDYKLKESKKIYKPNSRLHAIDEYIWNLKVYDVDSKEIIIDSNYMDDYEIYSRLYLINSGK